MAARITPHMDPCLLAQTRFSLEPTRTEPDHVANHRGTRIAADRPSEASLMASEAGGRRRRERTLNRQFLSLRRADSAAVADVALLKELGGGSSQSSL
jgi:hypothetical protein